MTDNIYRRRDGRWCARLMIGGQRYIRYGETKDKVAVEFARLRLKAQRGELMGTDRQTVGEFLDRWLADTVRPNLTTSTHALYEGILRLYLKPQVGHLQLRRLSAQHVRKMLTNLEQPFGNDLRRPRGRRRAALSGRTRQIVRGVLHRALQQALKDRIIETNVVATVDRPRATRAPFRTLDVREARRFLAAARSHSLYALFHLAVVTGARQGELLALHWSDIDLAKRTMHVQHTLAKDEEGQLRRTQPKTPRSRRQIELTDKDVQVMREHMRRNPSVPFVFSDGGGRPIEKDRLVRQELRPILKAAELPMIRFHDLRHTAATLMLGANVNPKVVSERLGHADIRITLDTYSHVTPTMQREAAEKLAALLG
jgi:integrase